jgi:hypothetical protein
MDLAMLRSSPRLLATRMKQGVPEPDVMPFVLGVAMSQSKLISFVTHSVASLVAVSSLASCDLRDSDHMPYTMKGLNVHVFDRKTDKEYFGGFVEGNYVNRERAVSQCAVAAQATATQSHLVEWSYVCCTVTTSSSCETKVR